MSGTGTFAHVTIKILEKEYNVACPIGSLQFRGTGTWVVTGGTGRFNDVTGSGTFNGRADFATQESSFVMSGTISAQGP